MSSPEKRWLVWQLADSAFPAGGFAHSAGLEAAWNLGCVSARKGEAGGAHGVDFESYVEQSLWQMGNGALPFVRAAWTQERSLAALDALADSTLANHIANRASRAQGRAFWSTVARVFEVKGVRELDERARSTSMHYAPIFGATLAVLGLDERETLSLYMHASLRGTLSAAVRLGIVGPLEAQRLHAGRGALLERIVESCAAIEPEDAAQTFPLADACGALHDELYARLFQS